MTIDLSQTSDEDLARQAYDFATRHPRHPLAENLRAKARPLNSRSPNPAANLELRILLDKARSLLVQPLVAKSLDAPDEDSDK